MGYIVKEADLFNEREIMINILKNNRTYDHFSYEKRFDWIYINNPFGKAKAWIIWDDKKNIPVGFTGVFPRQIYIDGKEYTCWNCGDFSIEKNYRVLGIALQLRKAAKECVDNGIIPFLYAHPNERMEVVHLKAGHKKIAKMLRFALPIRANRKIKNVVKNNFLTWLLSKPFNFILSLKYRFSTFLGLSGQLLDKIVITQEHEEIFRKMTEQFNIIGDRSKKYLDWKFGANPNAQYRQFDLFYKSGLIGTVFFILKNDTVFIIDILIDDFDRFAGQLFRMFINEVRKSFNRTVVSFSFILQEYNPFIPVLKKLGFRFRDDATSAVISYSNAEQEPSITDKILNGQNWFMTVGDRDA